MIDRALLRFIIIPAQARQTTGVTHAMQHNLVNTFSENHVSSPRATEGFLRFKKEIETKQSDYKPCSNNYYVLKQKINYFKEVFRLNSISLDNSSPRPQPHHSAAELPGCTGTLHGAFLLFFIRAITKEMKVQQTALS